MLDSYPLFAMRATMAYIKHQFSLDQQTVIKTSEFYRLLFHAQVFRYEVLGIYLYGDPDEIRTRIAAVKGRCPNR